MVFLSYSRQDQLRVDHLYDALTFRGFEIWMDRSSITGGDLWWRAIESAIASCAAAIVAVSPQSLASPTVQREIAAVERAQKPLIPVVVDGDPAAQGRFQVTHCIPLYKQSFQAALDQIAMTLWHRGVAANAQGVIPGLLQLIDGTWNVQMETQYGPSRLMVSFVGNGWFGGQLFTSTDPDGFSYEGRWQALTVCELLLQGSMRSFNPMRALQPFAWNIEYGLSRLTGNELRGFTRPDLYRCLWQRISN